jgi:hypothetical protein
MRRFMLALAGVLVVLTSVVDAQQEPPRLDPGQRVRVHEGNRKVVGTLLSTDSSALRVLTSHTDTAFLKRADVTAVDVSVGQRARTVSGALTGAGIGVVSVGFVTYALAGFPSITSGDESLVYVAAGMVGGLVLGAGVGAVIGAGSHTDRWEPAIWPTLTFSLGGPAGRSIALGGHLRF